MSPSTNPAVIRASLTTLPSDSLVAISGYHYGFAGLSTDNAELEKRFSIEFSHSHSRNLDLIKADRPSLAEVAVVSRSYLQSHLNDNPKDSDRFLVSDTPDQTYLLHIMARDNGPIDADHIGATAVAAVQRRAVPAICR